MLQAHLQLWQIVGVPKPAKNRSQRFRPIESWRMLPILKSEARVVGNCRGSNTFLKRYSLEEQQFCGMSEKMGWKEVKLANQSSTRPSPRWGHSSCLIKDEFVLFGGYADSTYMNDTWSFNTATLEWKEISTSGSVPSPRSNTTMSYDHVHNRLIVFGGGGNNKARFNEVNILDWSTKKWSSVVPQQTQQCPWERTYHSAELLYPYLVVFGGEGVADLEDLWVFNLQTLKWQEIPIDKNSVRPCARRFHSSCLVNNRLYVIAGCHAKYRLLHDVFSMDLTPLVENVTFEGLAWREQAFKEQGFLARWGHATAVLQKNIYIFGGRFSDDLNDVLVINTETNTLKPLKVSNQSKPKPRRRACLSFVGNCMLMFGGFNAYYYNDLFYINVTENVLKPSRIDENTQEKLPFEQYQLSNIIIVRSKDSKQFRVPEGIVAQYFDTEADLQQFLKAIDLRESQEDLKELLKNLQLGSGNSYLLRKFFEEDCSVNNEKIGAVGFNFKIQRPRCEKIESPCKLESRNSQATALDDRAYSQFVSSRQSYFYDLVIKFRDNEVMYCNTAMLVTRSKYFRGLFSDSFRPNNQLNQFNMEALGSQTSSIRYMQIVVDFLETDNLVIPQHFTMGDWFSLYQLADYLVLSSLKPLVLHSIWGQTGKENKQKVMEFAVKEGIEELAIMCARLILSTDPHMQFYPCRHMNEAYRQLRFELKQAQTTIIPARVQIKTSLSGVQEDDKENLENCQ